MAGKKTKLKLPHVIWIFVCALSHQCNLYWIFHFTKTISLNYEVLWYFLLNTYSSPFFVTQNCICLGFSTMVIVHCPRSYYYFLSLLKIIFDFSPSKPSFSYVVYHSFFQKYPPHFHSHINHYDRSFLVLSLENASGVWDTRYITYNTLL